MELYGLGREGAMIDSVLVSAAAPAAPLTPGLASSKVVNIHRYKAFSLQFIISSLTGAFVGTWLVEASNNWAPDPQENGQAGFAGNWTDVTSLFTPAITASATANGTMLVEPLARPNGWRALRASLTRVSGTSAVASLWLCGKGS